MAIAGLLIVATIAAALVLSLSSSAAAPIGPEGVVLQQVPNLAPMTTTAHGQPVDGITCRDANHQVVRYHIHVLVEIYVRGRRLRIPAGVGIPAPRSFQHLTKGLFIDNGLTGCLYWLHVHANDGVIHVEAPHRHNFTLGNFFDIWRQPLGPDEVGPATGSVVAFENGHVISNPRDILLLPGAVIQLDVGSPVVAFHHVAFHVSGLCASGVRTCAAK